MPTQTPTRRFVPTARAGAAPTNRHAQRAEDQPDNAAEEADRRAGDDNRADTFVIPLAGRVAPRPQEVDAEQEQYGADHDQECVSGQRGGHGRARDNAEHRGGSHPGDEPPVDASCADVRDTRGRGRQAGDADVRAGASGRTGRSEDDHRQADVSEHQSDEAARERGEEAPEPDCDEDESVQPLEYPAWRIGCGA